MSEKRYSNDNPILEEDFEENEEEEWGLTCWQKFRFFIKQSFKDIWRHKCQFCLSFCSVFVVVLSILVVVSITELGPIIFLRLSEKSVGQYDGVFTAWQGDHSINFSDFGVENFLSWANVKIAMEQNGKDYNLSPRF